MAQLVVLVYVTKSSVKVFDIVLVKGVVFFIKSV